MDDARYPGFAKEIRDFVMSLFVAAEGEELDYRRGFAYSFLFVAIMGLSSIKLVKVLIVGVPFVAMIYFAYQILAKIEHTY